MTETESEALATLNLMGYVSSGLSSTVHGHRLTIWVDASNPNHEVHVFKRYSSTSLFKGTIDGLFTWLKNDSNRI